jgi:hypothetical protein
MKLYIRLISGDILEYTCRGARNGRSRVETHESRIQQIVLNHLNLSNKSYEVKLYLESDAKEEEIQSDKKTIYYLEDSVLCALVEKSTIEEEDDPVSPSQAAPVEKTLKEKKAEWKNLLREVEYQLSISTDIQHKIHEFQCQVDALELRITIEKNSRNPNLDKISQLEVDLNELLPLLFSLSGPISILTSAKGHLKALIRDKPLSGWENAIVAIRFQLNK